MSDSEFDEISRKARIPVKTVKAVVDALREGVRDGQVRSDLLGRMPADGHGAPVANHTDPKVVDELIARAQKHSLGVDFLLEGYLGSVAAEFGAHAFTVEAARQILRNQKRRTGDPT